MAADIVIAERPIDATLERWFSPLFEHGTTRCAPNLATQLAFLRTGEIELSLTLNEAEWDNSWICSPWTHYISYAREEIVRAVPGFPGMVAGWLLATIGVGFRRAEFNRVVMVNNWLLSTNPWPRWDAANLPGVIEALTKHWPRHALVFRSLNAKECAPLLDAFVRSGGILIPSRQVWWYEPDSVEVAHSHEFRRDEKLLRRDDLILVPHESLSDVDFPALTKLYGDLYLDKYSRYNPQFTSEWLRHLHRENLARFTALREPGGRYVGVEACVELHGVLSSPVVGYDLSRPLSLGLYRRLAALPVLEARRRGLPLNLSAGVGRFKSLRGGEAVMEYIGVYDRHLPVRRRLPWRIVAGLSKHLLAPHVVRHGL